MWQLLAQLNGMVPQIGEENSGFILDFCSRGFAPNKRLPQLTGEPIDRNPLYFASAVSSGPFCTDAAEEFGNHLV
jgi:hypothetical protein